MKITAIKTFLVDGVFRPWTFVKVETDQPGLIGWGDCTDWGAARPIAATVERYSEWVIGRDPMQVEAIWWDLAAASVRHTGGIAWKAMSGIDSALWDIRGKQLGEPMHALLGGKLRDRVRMYCDCHSGAHWTQEDYNRRWEEVRQSGELDPVYEPEAYFAMAKEVVAEGYTAVKFDLDVPNPWKLDKYDRSISRRQHRHIVDTIAGLRAAVGSDIDLSIDLHGSFNLADALRICKDVEHLDLLWLEDPIRWEWGNVDALAKICMQTETPICTGEIFYGAKMFRELMEHQACDLLEPDIPRSGGAIEIRRIAELAEMYHMSLAPHYMRSAITGIAAVHICSTLPNFLALEHHSRNIPLWGEMLDLKNPIEEGYIAVPDGPGLGVELDEERLAAALPEGVPLWS